MAQLSALSFTYVETEPESRKRSRVKLLRPGLQVWLLQNISYDNHATQSPWQQENQKQNLVELESVHSDNYLHKQEWSHQANTLSIK